MAVTLIQKVKTALRVTTSTFDDEITDLIAAAQEDLRTAGVLPAVAQDPTAEPLVQRAVILYCKVNFGQPENYADLLKAYETQRSKLRSTTGMTDWGNS